ncbi:YggS family pyridoxal phosphate-dependent enzyme [Flavobacterium ardleyense]|uniref:YggS family pyridoxal phosphate-dependent enzyme n=1 Tax=Flavobacterium ardleyense TaxID=2038737 RepID=UPI00298C2CC3|nr:YggS family pyridoxal phosphate-dependent enzyme [Flavobacterium ardleyense]
MNIATRLTEIKKILPDNVVLVAVSKTKPVQDLMAAYNAGQRIFGENKIQEMTDKFEEMPKDIQWHMIGHVQRNKVKYMAPFVALVHGVDSLKLLQEINKQAEKNNRIISVLLQVFIADEETKFGFDKNEISEIFNSDFKNDYKNVKIEGLMGMATFTDKQEQIKEEFTTLKNLYDQFATANDLTVLSMGMSGDYKIAIDCGSTMVRIGSSIFGSR